MTERDPVLIIGVGLEGPESLGPAMLDRVQKADLLVGGSKVLEGFRKIPAARLAIDGRLKSLPGKISRAREAGKKVVVLASGDPNFFGIARFLRQEFAEGELEVHPHVSSMQIAFARTGLAWDDAFFLSLHGREVGPVVDAVRRHGKVGLLTGPENHPGRIARLLLKAGLDDCRAWVCCRLGGRDEKVVAGRLSEIERRRFPGLNVMVIVNGAPEPSLGPAGHSLAHDRGMITKDEVRAVTLMKLQMVPGA
ncbi:MAG: precorrin-6y C5,15-methyltransferase (decarboxylating) subunit CbiE, partial [Deltaproteobacteria bacterium]|nr:precorrin-6y C5,15-methyltransferase (decarboxylating) subunit CbiE [Deltaproteobacteria bacterium]